MCVYVCVICDRSEQLSKVPTCFEAGEDYGRPNGTWRVFFEREIGQKPKLEDVCIDTQLLKLMMHWR